MFCYVVDHDVVAWVVQVVWVGLGLLAGVNAGLEWGLNFYRDHVTVEGLSVGALGKER